MRYGDKTALSAASQGQCSEQTEELSSSVCVRLANETQAVSLCILQFLTRRETQLDVCLLDVATRSVVLFQYLQHLA